MNTNTTARASRIRPGHCANCRRPVTTSPVGLVHTDNNARHCAWAAARLESPNHPTVDLPAYLEGPRLPTSYTPEVTR